MSRYHLISAVLVLCALLVTACGAATTSAPAAPEVAATSAPAAGSGTGGSFKVGLLTSGPVNDQGWNQQAYDALLLMEKELGAEISYVELEESPAAFEKAFRDFASQGYQLVHGHGFQFQDAALTVGPEYPETVFLISSSRVAENNVIGVDMDSSQPYYLLGIMAAMMGKGAGLVGGVEIPPISVTFTGFTNGAHSVNPDFPVATTYLGNWTDVAGAKEAALSQVAQGADFLAPNANIAGQGVHQAAVEAGVWSFGTYGDQTELAPKNIVANYVADLGRGLVKIAADVKDGKFQPGKNYVFGLESPDVMWITYNEGADLVVPSDVREAVEEAKEKIVAGEINTLEGAE